MLLSESVQAANQGVDPSPVLVVHLRGFAGLSEGVSFVDEQDHSGGRLPYLFGRADGSANLFERSGKELRHLAHRSAASGRKTKSEEKDRDLERARHLVAESLGESGLS